MMMKKGGVASFAAWCAVTVMAVVLVAEVQEAAAVVNCNPVNCNPAELAPCVGAFNGAQNPTPECCHKLKEQVPCLCKYLKDPKAKPYIASPNFGKVANACGAKWPMYCPSCAVEESTVY